MDNTNIYRTDFIKICRVCLKQSDNFISISLFQIIEMMTSCTSVQIWINDELPNQICENCLDDLQNAFKFKKTSEISDCELREILKNDLNNKEINDLSSAEDNFDQSDTQDDDKLSIVNIKIDSGVDSKTELEEKLKYSCDECNFTCNYVHHLGLHKKRYHSAKGEKCKKCSLVFYHNLHYEKHLKSHKKDFRKSRKCNICNKVFKTPSKLIRHSAVHATDRPFKCETCGKSFKLDSALKIHIHVAHTPIDSRIPCNVCGKHVIKRHIQRHLIVHKNNRDLVQCPQCSRKFLHQSSVKTHIRRDHENIARELKYLCNTCGKKCGSRIELERHSVVHKPERPYLCTECGKGFKLNFSLTKHIKTMHSNINVHIRVPCKICSKQISKTNMHTHLKIHKKNRDMIKCSKCSKEFLHQISLKQHVQREHENIARDLKHLCNICGKGAGSRAELDIHMRTHSDEKSFECDKCGIKYKSRAGLTHHVKTTHLNIKPHACSICSQRFALKATLSSHIRTHTGERPFSCVICEKSFSQKSSLRTHMKLVHSNVVLYADIRNSNDDIQ